MEERQASARLKRPSWKDPRLLLGILLVLVSIAGVVLLVGGASKTVPAYVATAPIAVGQKLTKESFSLVQIQLGDIQGKYYEPATPLPENAVAIRMIPQGELVPISSVGQSEMLDRKPVSVTVSEPLPPQVVVGSHVDVWVALPNDHNGFEEPTLMLPGVEVASVTDSQTSFASSKSTQLMVLVKDEQMPKFLGAVANKAKVSVVWNPGTIK